LHIDAPTKWFAEFIRRHQLPALSLHGLRHTAATIMVEAGVPLRAVSEHLGHGQVSTTANIYVHTTQASRERAAEALANALIKMPK
jgi:integrase